MHAGKLVLALVACAVASVATCSHVVARYERAFELTGDGESAPDVIARFGKPSVREVRTQPFLRYATSECNAPCSERLWWEHPVLRGIEAWSVELNSENRVIGKAHWVSP
jgi:hypothetical protein